MRKAAVYLRYELAGVLTEVSDTEYIFRYDDKYFMDIKKPAISVNIDKSQQEHHSKFLFPFFFQHVVGR